MNFVEKSDIGPSSRASKRSLLLCVEVTEKQLCRRHGCFLCRTRSDFDELCNTIQQQLMKEAQALFEICEKRPAHWGPNADVDLQNTSLFTEFEDIDRQFDDSDEEFEIL